MNTSMQSTNKPRPPETDPEEVPPIITWEVEAALKKMKNGKEAGKDQVNIETLKAGGETIAKQLATV